MRRRQWDVTLYELAEAQAGYFTAAQVPFSAQIPTGDFSPSGTTLEAL